MTWFKVDDKLHDHRKARAAGATAMGVWCLAGSWAADNLTDGFIPATILARWGRPRDANRLVQVGLWHADEQDGEKGWRFHEWHERQPSRAQKLAEREVRAEAGRVGGLRSGRSRREANAKQVASPVLEPPSRPVPSEEQEGRAPRSEVTPSYFDDFWAAYPRKESKGHARTAFTKAAKKAEPSVIIDAAMAFGRRVAGSDPKFIAHPTTWLNGERWDDEALEVAVVDTGWHTPWTPPIAPPEIADNPELYGPWLDEQRKAAGR